MKKIVFVVLVSIITLTLWISIILYVTINLACFHFPLVSFLPFFFLTPLSLYFVQLVSLWRRFTSDLSKTLSSLLPSFILCKLHLLSKNRMSKATLKRITLVILILTDRLELIFLFTTSCEKGAKRLYLKL